MITLERKATRQRLAPEPTPRPRWPSGRSGSGCPRVPARRLRVRRGPGPLAPGRALRPAVIVAGVLAAPALVVLAVLLLSLLIVGFGEALRAAGLS
jgi:hypothetical protein